MTRNTILSEYLYSTRHQDIQFLLNYQNGENFEGDIIVDVRWSGIQYLQNGRPFWASQARHLGPGMNENCVTHREHLTRLTDGPEDRCNGALRYTVSTDSYEDSR